MVAVSKAYIWAYACFQFAIVILFAHVYYAIVRISISYHFLLISVSIFWMVLIIVHNILSSSFKMQLNMNAVLSVFLSALTGFGVAICINSLLIEYLKWRRSRLLRSADQQMSVRSPPQVQQQPLERLQQERLQPHSHQHQAIVDQSMGH